MVFGKFLADLATGAVKEYVNRRGIDGMIEDAGNLKNKVTDMFSSNDNDDYDYSSDYEYQESGDDFWETLDAFIEEDDFHGAEVFVQKYVGKEGKDDFFYYAMAYIFNIKAVVTNSHEDERKAKNYITNAVNTLNGDSEWRNSVYALKRKIDDNLRAFKKEKEEEKRALNEWEAVSKLFDLDNECSGNDAITALERYYSDRNEEHDIYYHFLLYRGYEKKIIIEDSDPEEYFDDMRKCVDIALEIGKSNHKDNGEIAKNLKESFLYWENIHYETVVHELISAGDFSKAYTTAQKLANDETLYTRVMTRLESLRLLDMVTTGKPSESAVKRKIFEVEDIMRRACNLEEDKEISAKIREAAEERITVAKQYLEGKLQLQNSTTTTKDVIVSDGEAEYLEELRACFEDGVITDKERRLLDRLRKSLGISETRAAELEAMCHPQSMTEEEQEYANEVKVCLEDDGEITVKERRLLDRLAKSLGISSDRALQIENLLLSNNS